MNNGLDPQCLVCGHFQINIELAKYIEIIGPLTQAFPVAGGLVTYWLLSCSLEITGESLHRDGQVLFQCRCISFAFQISFDKDNKKLNKILPNFVWESQR